MINNLPEINFANKDPKLILSEILSVYKDESGRELSQADPLYTIFNVLTSLFVGVRANIDFTGKQNLLAYAEDAYLDHKVVDFDLKRIEALNASVTIKFTLSQVLAKDYIIPKHTLVTADSKVFFESTQEEIIKAGELSIDLVCIATIAGEIGNGYLPGTIVTQVNPLPFIAGVINIDISAGGINKESNESLRERRLVAPQGLSTAGPDKGYINIVRNTNPSVIDVEPYSPSPGVVQIIPLMIDGRFPTSSELEIITRACSAKDKRPLTDKVEAVTPKKFDYEIKFKYWVSSKAEIDIAQIQSNINDAVKSFIYQTKTKLGRAINPSLLEQMIMNAGARRVEINKPLQTELTCLQVGNNTACDIEYGGIEKDY